MKVTLVAVISIDGKLTRSRESNIHEWTSKEDHEMHRNLIASHKVIIMGRKTYSAWKLKPKTNQLIIVQTRSPEKYTRLAVEGQLEFTNDSPKEIIKRLQSRGIDEVMIDGGGQTNGEFMSAGLVTDMLITIEPYVFGSGINLFADIPQNSKLKLVSSKVLNKEGTLLLHFKPLN